MKFKTSLGKTILFLATILVAIAVFSPWSANASENNVSVELILDASGSMNGLLKSGESKISAAKKAVEMLVKEISPETIIAFRAYGHQSHRKKKDCKDTQLLVNFAPLSKNRNKIISKANALTARGYTPISYVLKLASEDFSQQTEKQRIIVLVSDGKETCKGDPCVTAKALAKAGISKLVIHTVGFGVDDAAKVQLECIARVTGGRYFSASNAKELVEALSTAVETVSSQKTETIIVIKEKAPGVLKIINPDITGHDVIDAETGKNVANISKFHTSVKLKQGIYNVKVGAALWKSVEVKSGETTVLRPGRLTVKPAGLRGAVVLDAETGEKQGSVSNFKNSIALMPGFYVVSFGRATWPVEIKEGENKLLRPGVVKVVNARVNFINIRNTNGEIVGHVSNSLDHIPLPPGNYSIEINKEQYKFSLKEGETKIFKLKRK